jgi:anthranilate synthase component II
MLLMIDNYDSFTFNLVQYFAELGETVKVVRNDEVTLDEIAAMKPERLVLSPGPCSPAEAGICVPALQRFTGQLPILGVCLGHQSIGAALGGKVVRASEQMHGKTSVITTDQLGVYAGLPEQFTVTRYHSLAIERASLPDCLAITSTTPDGEIMGVRHKGPQTDAQFAPLEGVQFHPESILTEHGHAMLKNFLDM